MACVGMAWFKVKCYTQGINLQVRFWGGPERFPMADLAIVRGIFIAVLTVLSAYQRPFGLSTWEAGLLGLLLSLAIIIFEIRLKQASLTRLMGAAVGSILGILGAFLMSLVVGAGPFEHATKSFLQILLMLLMAYIGLVVGAKKGDMLNLAALGGLFGAEPARKSLKLLDTSVIIDGRIADICETGFVDGILIIPRFVLRELQLVADSADSQKRNRGRRGLDVLQRIQKMAHLNVQIGEEDFPNVRDVDLKLIELAKLVDAKIVTNDFNLNKVAQLQGVGVLNINDLANSLKPIVLPGEIMRVFVLKEGKEYNQGVGYLDDGTMVVVDNARKMINRTVDVTVTSVLQTTAGKMIFGKYDERAQRPGTPGPRPVDVPPAEGEATSNGGARPAREPSPRREAPING
jgi:uncharacterized protein YacL